MTHVRLDRFATSLLGVATLGIAALALGGLLSPTPVIASPTAAGAPDSLLPFAEHGWASRSPFPGPKGGGGGMGPGMVGGAGTNLPRPGSGMGLVGGSSTGMSAGAPSGGTSSMAGAPAGSGGKATTPKASGAGTGTAGGLARKSGANTSKASKARVAWLVTRQRERLPWALEAIYQAELDAANDGAFFALRATYALPGPGPEAPPQAPDAAPKANPTAPAPPPTAPPSAAPDVASPLSDGSALPTGADELQALAVRCEREGRHGDALRAAQSLAHVRGSAKDLVFVGFLWERADDLLRADEAYDRALAVDATLVGARTGKVLVAIRAGKSVETVAALLPAANEPSDDVLLWLATSAAAAGAKQPERARAALERAGLVAGTDAARLRAVIDLGLGIEIRGPLPAVLDVARRATPDDRRLSALRLLLLVEDLPPVAAQKALDEARAYALEDPLPLLLSAILALREEKLDRAISLGRQAIVLAPTNGRAALVMAHALDRRGSKEAVAAYGLAAELDHAVAEPWIAMGLLAHDKGDYTDAEGKLLAAARAEPADPEPLHYLAIVQGDRLGLLGKAIETLRSYASLGGDDEAALEWLAALEEAQGE